MEEVLLGLGTNNHGRKTVVCSTMVLQSNFICNVLLISNELVTIISNEG
jgi:hypothetical protein